MTDRVSPALIWNGLRTSQRSCTLCASDHVRRSRMRAPWLARRLGLVACRCQTCWRLFLLSSRTLEREGGHAIEYS